MKAGFGQRTDDRHGVHVFGCHLRHLQARRDGALRKFDVIRAMRLARQFGFFHGSGQNAVAQHRRRGVTQNSANS